MDIAYDTESWAERTDFGRRIVNFGYRMVDDDLPGWRLVKDTPIETSRPGREVAYIWQQGDERDRLLVRVTIAELDDWRTAHKRLADELGASMRSDIPLGTGPLNDLGDVSYVARESVTDIPASIWFTRGNTLVTVASVGRQTVRVDDIAILLDRALVEPPRAEVRTTRHVSDEPIEVKVEHPFERRVVVPDLKTRTRRNAWVKVTAPDGELLRKDDSLVYVPPEKGLGVTGTVVILAVVATVLRAVRKKDRQSTRS